MRAMTRRRDRLSATLVLTVLGILGMEDLAQAQQGGLFPLAGTHRRRDEQPCDQEPAIYKMYRQEYFGYHPTCWRQFPGGWGCPSPYAANKAEEYRKLPLTKPKPLDADNDDAPPDASAPLPPGDEAMPGNIPDLPDASTPSPFNLDNAPKPGAALPPADLPRRDSAQPPAAAEPSDLAPPANAPSPFDVGLPPAATATPPQASRPRLLPGRTVSLANTTREMPVIAMPEAPETGMPAASSLTLTPPPGTVIEGLPVVTEPEALAPVQAPQRRGILTGLFDRANKRRR
ncbi:hypothetical protein EP7_004190 [Isosphaeraceae bacterium EP7]